MGQPIKDRGIRWVESYGDKSSYLKEEMERQVGPGSYFRWEGHDYTTGTDYYVVVSPGYSKEKGYHFFAGLRKMPADQGASGKKFKTQGEALSYAMDTWRVMRPATKPAKRYTINDIINIPIVLEPQHDKRGSSVSRVITSDTIVEAMSMTGSGHVTSNFVPKAGKKTYPEELCWAYKLSPTMGFLSALYTRKRFMGTEVANVAASGPESKAYNEFTGQYEKAPMAPLYATCEAPPKETFDSTTKRVNIDNQLVKVTRGPDGKVLGFNVNPPLRSKEDDSYSLVRWGDVIIKPTITLQPQVFHGTDIGSLWAQLDAINGVMVPPEARSQKTGRGKGPVELRFEVMPEAYDQLISTTSKFLEGKGLKMFPPFIGNQIQKDLVDIVAHQKEKNVPIDWNTPYYETMGMSGSQLMVYDNLGMPMGLKLSRSTYASNEAKMQSEEHGDEGHSYILRNPSEFVTDTIFPGYSGPGDDNMTSPIVQFIGESLERFHSQKDEKAKAEAIDVIRQLDALAKAQDQNGLMALSNSIGPRIQKPMARSEFFSAITTLEDARREANALISDGSDKAGIAAAQNKVKSASATIKPMLTAFKALASHNLLSVTNEHVLDSRTCAPVMHNVKSQSYDVDSSLLPTPNGQLAQDGKSVVAWKDHVPPFAVRAKKEKLPDGKFSYAGRRYDPAQGKYLYGPLPDGANPYQQSSGMRVSVEDPAMYFPREDGSLYEIQKSVWTRYNPDSRGEAIPGEAYDISMGPPMETSAKGGRHLLDARMSQDAFRAVMQKHRVKEEGGVIRGIRRYNSTPLFNADPKTNKDAYRYTTSSGKEVDLSQNAEKRGQYVYFHDSADLMRMMMKRMGMTEADFGPFTPVSSEDLRISYDVMIEGVHYYRSINHYDKLANTNEGRKYSTIADESMIPPGEVQSFRLFKDGQQAKNSFDRSKYEYGRICEACGKGDAIQPEIVSAMHASLQNPEEALKPKAGTLWVIEYSSDGGSWERLQSKDGEDSYPVLFGSKMMAEMNAGMRDKTVMNLGVKDLMAQGMQIRVAPIQSPSMTPHRSADQQYKTRQATSLIRKIGEYNSGRTREEVEAQREDRHSADYASPDDDPNNIVTPQSMSAERELSTQELYDELVPAEHASVEPEPTAPPEPVQEPSAPMAVEPPLAAPAAPPPAVATEAQPQVQAPPVEVDRLVRQWQSQGKSPDDMRARSRAHQGKPYYGDLMSAIDRMSGKGAKSIGRLIALANRLDMENRASDADAIDRVIKVAMDRANNA